MFYLYSNLIQRDNLFREQMSKVKMLLKSRKRNFVNFPLQS